MRLASLPYTSLFTPAGAIAQESLPNVYRKERRKAGREGARKGGKEGGREEMGKREGEENLFSDGQ